jgi:hypothetical protein
MGPLVYYCRWHGVKLRLHGRDERFVWGQLVTQDAGSESAESFRFDLKSWELLLGEGEDQTRLQLDELGVVIPTADKPPPMTSAGDGLQ